jgi:hypothetical protein
MAEGLARVRQGQPQDLGEVSRMIRPIDAKGEYDIVKSREVEDGKCKVTFSGPAPRATLCPECGTEENDTSKRRIKVLLVGRPSGNSLELLLWLYKRGCLCYFATTSCEASELISRTEFDLVLSQYQLPDGTAFCLSGWLEGSRAALFLSMEANGGCLWLPILKRGKSCIGAPMLGSSDFPVALEKVLGAEGMSDPLSSSSMTEFQLSNTLQRG